MGENGAEGASARCGRVRRLPLRRRGPPCCQVRSCRAVAATTGRRKSPGPRRRRYRQGGRFRTAGDLDRHHPAQVQNDLSFRLNGKIIERSVDVGDHVMADQILARLDPRTQEADVESATAGLQSAEAQLKQETATYQRQKALIDAGFTTRTSFDQAEQSLRTAQASLDSANNQRKSAENQLSYTILKAGETGVITARFAEVGQVRIAPLAPTRRENKGLRHCDDRQAPRVQLLLRLSAPLHFARCARAANRRSARRAAMLPPAWLRSMRPGAATAGQRIPSSRSRAQCR